VTDAGVEFLHIVTELRDVVSFPRPHRTCRISLVFVTVCYIETKVDRSPLAAWDHEPVVNFFNRHLCNTPKIRNRIQTLTASSNAQNLAPRPSTTSATNDDIALVQVEFDLLVFVLLRDLQLAAVPLAKSLLRSIDVSVLPPHSARNRVHRNDLNLARPEKHFAIYLHADAAGLFIPENLGDGAQLF